MLKNKQIPPHVRSKAVPAAIEAFGHFKPVLVKYPKARRVLTCITVAQVSLKAFKGLREALKQEVETPPSWSLTIKSDDSLYDVALELMASFSTQNWQAVKAETRYEFVEGEFDEDGDPVEKSVIVMKPSERAERNFVIDGHAISAYVDTFSNPGASRPGAAPRVPASGQQMLAMGMPITTRQAHEVVFIATSEEGQKAVVTALQARYDAKQEMSGGSRFVRKPQLFRMERYGSWNRAGELPIRPVDSVAVTDGQVQGVVDDIKAFRALEPEYVRRGVPFHRGYLLYGPPGTGKTSAIKAIAHAVGADLYAANLGTMNDGSLAELVQGVSRGGNRAILLLEDIDAFGAARQRDEDDPGQQTGSTAGISTTGLLNALDGVETPHGLITILTTNHPESLDDALVRPGRVDKKFYFGYPDDATVERHYEFFFSRKPSVPLYANGRSGAELNEVFVSNMTDPDAAEAALSVITTDKQEHTA